MMRGLLVLALLTAAAPCRAAGPALKMVTIDTEEDAATLFVTPDGRITVTNSRNGFSKVYRVK
jgi:hypothetical protein